ncbi:unnamed protein product [Oikopleura dioica]|uniref:Nucleotidyl transferase domain-containing protein n=1 Tax=Oikopleura dioica TaxID=34765 RepID=E4YKP2_OIKDI|nr:unnamed protein product [Oikopleura dioica]
MKCVILVAGHGTLLENEIREKGPKELVGPAVGKKKILDIWWKIVNQRTLFSDVYLVTNADKYKYYERWATANDFPVSNIINDGSTSFHNSLGAAEDLQLVLNTAEISEDIVVVAGDMLFEEKSVDMCQIIQFYRRFTKYQYELSVWYWRKWSRPQRFAVYSVKNMYKFWKIEKFILRNFEGFYN